MNVVIMDAVGLLFFLVPGIVAFAVDFYNGAIYYPTGGGEYMYEKNIFDAANRPSPDKLREIIEQTVSKGTGIAVKMNGKDLKVAELHDISEFSSVYARYQTSDMVARNF